MNIGRLSEIIGDEIELFISGGSSVKRLNAISNAARAMIACAVLELDCGIHISDKRKVKLLK